MKSSLGLKHTMGLCERLEDLSSVQSRMSVCFCFAQILQLLQLSLKGEVAHSVITPERVDE